MLCANCGTQNDDNNFRCTNCGVELRAQPGVIAQQPYPPPPPQYGGVYPATIPNYLVQSILATLFCCMPAGIVAIVFAAQVNGKLAAGDIAGAQAASKNAKTWTWVSFGVGIGIVVLYLGAAAISIAMSEGF
jgi:Interferon-induced transmembrane protein